MLTYTPVDLPGPNDGAIELYESLANERSHARATLVRAAVTTAVLVLLCVGLTFGFGLLFVARPLRRLALKARRIGEGDLGTPLHVAQRDEIRDVAIAMNEMCDRLAETRAGLEEETAAKLAALEQVRHLDRLRIIGQLASRIAHELGTPLNVVRVRGAMIAEAQLPVARLRELGATIVEQSDRMTGIIRELLLFARRDPARPYPTDLVRIVKQAVEWLHPLAVEHGVALELESAVDDLPLTVDPSRIQQAVTNLILNAIHASPPGETVRVRVRSGDEACIEIVDQGAGIPVEDAGRLFEPFFTTKPAGEGTGLGLSIANEIVHEHGGRICLESGRGPGAVFSIRLPHPGGMKTAHP
jgi:signal transduction histidine kinase